MTNDAYKELLDLISHYEQVVSRQSESIIRLINENVEQENIIKEWMREQ
ncbi:hypothetical protein [Oceanobacillus sp. CF4.6]